MKSSQRNASIFALWLLFLAAPMLAFQVCPGRSSMIKGTCYASSCRRPSTHLSVFPELFAGMDVASWMAAGLTTAAVAATVSSGGAFSPKTDPKDVLMNGVVVDDDDDDKSKDEMVKLDLVESKNGAAAKVNNNKKQLKDLVATPVATETKKPVEAVLESQDKELLEPAEDPSEAQTIVAASAPAATVSADAATGKASAKVGASVQAFFRKNDEPIQVVDMPKETVSKEPISKLDSVSNGSEKMLQNGAAVATATVAAAAAVQVGLEKYAPSSAERDGLTDEIRDRIEKQARDQTRARMELKKQRKQDETVFGKVKAKMAEDPSSEKPGLIKTEDEVVGEVKVLKLPKDDSKAVAVEGGSKGVTPIVRPWMKKKRSLVVLAAAIVIGKRLITTIISRGII